MLQLILKYSLYGYGGMINNMVSQQILRIIIDYKKLYLLISIFLRYSFLVKTTLFPAAGVQVNSCYIIC